MVFASPVFLFLFLPAVFFVYGLACLTRKSTIKNLSLLTASLVFYSWGGLRYTVLLLISTAVNFWLGLRIEKAETKERKSEKKRLLIISIIYNIGILFVFKYIHFVVTNLGTLGAKLFGTGQPEFPVIALPIGISFFTFQIMSYIFDVYQQKVKAQHHILDLALYIMLFPQLIAGPIVRYIDINREIRNRCTDLFAVRDGIARFMVGFIKKILLANPMGSVADTVFRDPGVLNMPYAWMGVICYGLQIYLDFSAYSDMAIGLGKLFGFHFLENFNYPYCSGSVKEFWRRWHISLSSWFRDYVYIPLGGSRTGAAKTCRNLLIVFILTGFWHGASWNFVVWGLFHGFFLVLERGWFGRFMEKRNKVLRHSYTLTVVLAGWVFFRCETLPAALTYLRAMFCFQLKEPGVVGILECLDREYITVFLVSLAVSLPIVPWLKNHWRGGNQIADLERLGLLAAFSLSVFYMAGADFNPFIYFRF